jgi:hypothetical protein
MFIWHFQLSTRQNLWHITFTNLGEAVHTIWTNFSSGSLYFSGTTFFKIIYAYFYLCAMIYPCSNCCGHFDNGHFVNYVG